MNYSFCELPGFCVIGQRVELTGFQKQNIQISMKFWKQFNQNLKKAYLSQGGNWTKYAFMEKEEGRLYYYCSIPKSAVVPENFLQKEICAQQYLVAEHRGQMSRIYETYREIYQNLLPGSGCVPCREEFLHFEKYDERFGWNQEHSVIEIWVPVKRM